MTRPELRPREGHRDEPFLGRPHRLYVALTTSCNRACPWCSTSSSPRKTSFMDRATFEALLPCKGSFELQLEGGEPTLHPELITFARLARATGRCTRVVLATNGVLCTPAFLERLGSPLTVKVSVNHHLIEADPEHVARVKALVDWSAGRDVEVVVNVRRRRGAEHGDDAWVVEAARELIPWANVFFLQRYGLARDDERLEPPFIVGEDFTLANPDGRTFGQDLVARADAMAELA